MTSEERAKKYKEMQAKREKVKKDNEFGDYEKFDMPEFKCLALKPNKGFPLRLMGESLETRCEKSDPLLVEKSMIIADDGKFFQLIWSSESDHPMRKLRKAIEGKYKWDSEKKARVYENEGSPVLKRFLTNNTVAEFNQGMLPQKYILCNVLDKSDNWCKDNKHTKLGCWDSTTKEVEGKEVTYYTYGFKASLISEIWDVKATSMQQHPEDFDVLVRRLDKKTKQGNSYLQVNIPEEKSAIKRQSELDGVDYLPMLSDDYLTDGERAYERYDLEDIPFISSPTPCGTILKKLGKFIKEVDVERGTNLYEEFVIYKEKEILELKSKKGEDDTSTKDVKNEVVQNEEVVESDLPSEVEETPTQPVARKVKKSIATENVNKVHFSENPVFIEMFGEVYEQLSEEDKALILDWNEEEGYKFTDKEDLAQCPTCENDIPDPMMTCCFCAEKFD